LLAQAIDLVWPGSGVALRLLAVAMMVAGIAPASLAGAATLGAVPIAFAVLAVSRYRYGVETRRRSLEDITDAELAADAVNRARRDGVHRAMDYLIIEAGSAPGTFFRTFPRHRSLIAVVGPLW
jgi:hypothetical protein